jgi:hypothetical protein
MRATHAVHAALPKLCDTGLSVDDTGSALIDRLACLGVTDERRFG